MASAYLLMPVRTLLEACCKAHPEMVTRNCDTCPHGELCAISEQIECDRQGNGAKVTTKPFRKAA